MAAGIEGTGPIVRPTKKAKFVKGQCVTAATRIIACNRELEGVVAGGRESEINQLRASNMAVEAQWSLSGPTLVPKGGK